MWQHDEVGLATRMDALMLPVEEGHAWSAHSLDPSMHAPLRTTLSISHRAVSFGEGHAGTEVKTMGRGPRELRGFGSA